MNGPIAPRVRNKFAPVSRPAPTEGQSTCYGPPCERPTASPTTPTASASATLLPSGRPAVSTTSIGDVLAPGCVCGRREVRVPLVSAELVRHPVPHRLLPSWPVGDVDAQARLAPSDERDRHRTRCGCCWPVRPHRGDRSHSAQHARSCADSVTHVQYLDADSYIAPNADAQTHCHTSTDAKTHARVHARLDPNT